MKPFHVGMPPPYHHTIAIVYISMSMVHAVCIFLVLGGSLSQHSLAFTPWTTYNASVIVAEVKTTRTSSVVVWVYAKIMDRRSLCGVNRKHFHAVLICRVVETALQTVQAYRMSMLLPLTLLNRFYVIAVNCWSSVIAYSAISRRDEARRRLMCIVLDCMLDLIACMGVELIVLQSYASEYDTNLRGFNQYLWYDDEWVAQAINEFRILVVVSWSDLVSRTISLSD